MNAKEKRLRERPIIGWREWVALPAFGVQKIKAKIDSGARTSAIHAWRIEAFEKQGVPWVKFDLHPLQKNNTLVVRAEARVYSRKRIRSSNGKTEERFIIATDISIGEATWECKIGLTNRDEMGFRMLIGRDTMRNQFLVATDSSFLAGVPASLR